VTDGLRHHAKERWVTAVMMLCTQVSLGLDIAIHVIYEHHGVVTGTVQLVVCLTLSAFVFLKLRLRREADEQS
jgi:hypothetical protein